MYTGHRLGAVPQSGPRAEIRADNDSGQGGSREGAKPRSPASLSSRHDTLRRRISHWEVKAILTLESLSAMLSAIVSLACALLTGLHLKEPLAGAKPATSFAPATKP